MIKKFIIEYDTDLTVFLDSKGGQMFNWLNPEDYIKEVTLENTQTSTSSTAITTLALLDKGVTPEQLINLNNEGLL